MKITYWSDFACPYCYIGNTRLKRAIDDLNLDVEFDIRAFELDQNAPKDVQSTTVDRFAVKYGMSIDDAYFVKNLKLADHEVLLETGLEAGLSEDEINDVLDSDLYNLKVEEDENIALSAGIHAVPFYLLDGKYSIPGALSYEDFKSVLSQIIAENEVDDDKDADNCANGVCAI